MNPSNYCPQGPDDFIGDASRILRVLLARVERGETGPLKLLLYGAPGTGKSALAGCLARRLVAHASEITHLNGRDASIDRVRQWRDSLAYAGMSLLGGWTVFLVDELDTMPSAAQDALLTFLDKLPGRVAFIGTSNLQLDLLSERFQSRLQQFRVTCPDTGSIAGFLHRFNVPLPVAQGIAVACGGNVRAACLDAQSHLDGAAIEPLLPASELPIAKPLESASGVRFDSLNYRKPTTSAGIKAYLRAAGVRGNWLSEASRQTLGAALEALERGIPPENITLESLS